MLYKCYLKKGTVYLPTTVNQGNVPADVEIGRAGVARLEPLGSGCRIHCGEQRHDESYHDFTDDTGSQP